MPRHHSSASSGKARRRLAFTGFVICSVGVFVFVLSDPTPDATEKSEDLKSAEAPLWEKHTYNGRPVDLNERAKDADNDDDVRAERQLGMETSTIEDSEEPVENLYTMGDSKLREILVVSFVVLGAGILLFRWMRRDARRHRRHRHHRHHGPGEAEGAPRRVRRRRSSSDPYHAHTGTLGPSGSA